MNDQQRREITARALAATLNYSEQHHFLGHNKHDGLASPVLSALLGWGRWPRMVAIQLVTRSPIDLRTWLLTPRIYNPKGLALFIQAYLRRYRSLESPSDLQRIDQLVSILGELRRPGPSRGRAWGYGYPWQDPGFFAPAWTPNAVVTIFVCEALLELYAVRPEAHLLAWVEDAIVFLLNDLPKLKDESDELCLGYMPMPMRMRVMDVSVLIGAMLARYAKVSARSDFTQSAYRLVNYVIRQQTDYGAWYYTDPPGDSHITHDNYHTAFILDAIRRYGLATGDAQFTDSYQRGLQFYVERLFNPDGAPRWTHVIDFPHDVHGAANGIITLSRHAAEYPGAADRTLDWALGHLYAQEGRFYYQQGRWYTKKFTLMRWCNAWMCRAMATYLYGEIDP